MSKITALFFLLISNSILAQFGIINDSDGYANVRRTAKKEDNINGKLYNGDVVYVFESEGNWSSVDFYNDKKELSGYIYSDRVKQISDYKQIPIKTDDGNRIVLQSKEIKITLIETAVNMKNYKAEYVDDTQLIKSLNGKPVFGKDGGAPETEYQSITIEFGKQKITLPKEALVNLFEPSLKNSEAHYDSEKDILYLQSMNSDGAGSYYVIWTIENQKYKGRNIAFGF
jgi:hypothetical protein